MVAKINYGSSLYGALAYNGEKVNEGVAKILETNKMFSPADGTHDISACMQDFMAYMLFGNEHALSVSDVQGLQKGGFVIASLFLKETCRVSLGMLDERGGVTDGYF